MLRQDYFMRLIQELMDLLVRTRALKRQGNYEQALQEIDLVVKKLQADAASGERYALPDLLDLCLHEHAAPHEQMAVLANVFTERGELLLRLGHVKEAMESYALALGLHLEVLHLGYVTSDTISKVECLVDLTTGVHLGNEVFLRLVRYLEERAMFGRAEDVFFTWLEQGEPMAGELGLAFYERLEGLTDEALQRGELPRAEVREGCQAFTALLGELASRS